MKASICQVTEMVKLEILKDVTDSHFPTFDLDMIFFFYFGV